ncbi:unnamed protein product, partial [Iphiclides podalirius]
MPLSLAGKNSGRETRRRKEVQKRWRSIRDSYTKAYRQGKCVPPEQCPPGTRRYQYHRQMSFLHLALQNKKPRYSQDKYESYSEVSNSPQHPPPEDAPRVKHEPSKLDRPLDRSLDRPLDKPLDLKTKPDLPEKSPQSAKQSPSLEIKIDANAILPEDHFDDDRLFMNSLLPLFRKMDDDTRLLCRIEVLKIIRYALQGNKRFELQLAEDGLKLLAKEEMRAKACPEGRLSMTTRSADGSRPVKKRRARSPSPLPMPPKKRGPGRPRKVRPPPSDSEEEHPPRKQFPKLKVPPVEIPHLSEYDETLSRATSVSQLPKPLFMRMYNLERSKPTLATPPSPQSMQVSVKSEPMDTYESSLSHNTL